MYLREDRNVNRYVDQQLRTMSVKAATIIYRGSFVGKDVYTGFARPLMPGDLFCGIAYERCDNGNGADGDRDVTLFTLGDFEFNWEAASEKLIGNSVCAFNDSDISLCSSPSESRIGVIVGVSKDRVVVRLATFGA